MTKILVISDDGVSSGYGRIAMEVNRRLHKRGYEISALSVAYDGILPAMLDGSPLPYWVGGMAGRDMMAALLGTVNALQPDIIHVVQDAPYATMVFNSPIDWSRHALMITTPVDGVPIDPDWIALFKQADGMLTISQFGVEAHARMGVRSELCRPGVDLNTFYRYTDAERQQLRVQAGIDPGAFVLMTAAQNQGRKAIPSMMKGFFEFAQDKPTARYILDMERDSPAGWNLIKICRQWGWDESKLIFRDTLIRAGINTLAMRFNLCDAHAVLAFREGYGMPLGEAMACGAVSMAMDYCSGTEIVGDGKGSLIPPIPHADLIGTWGGAVDKIPDVRFFTHELEDMYARPHVWRGVADRGMAWARAQTWDNATDAVQRVIERIVGNRKPLPPPAPPTPASASNPPTPTASAAPMAQAGGGHAPAFNGDIPGNLPPARPYNPNTGIYGHPDYIPPPGVEQRLTLEGELADGVDRWREAWEELRENGLATPQGVILLDGLISMQAWRARNRKEAFKALQFGIVRMAWEDRSESQNAPAILALPSAYMVALEDGDD